MCWSHIKSAAYGSGCLSEMITRAVIARYHCCSLKNAADPNVHVYTDTSSSMEGYAANKCFQELVGILIILFACFDGDASTPQHLITHHPDAFATRDPNHIAKNVWKCLKQTYKELKYCCTCCPNVINKNGTKNRNKTHNPITDLKAKSAQVWIGKILRETKGVEEARKLVANFLDHLEGKCKEGGGCQHSFNNYKHKSPINCQDMIDRIRQYFGSQASKG